MSLDLRRGAIAAALIVILAATAADQRERAPDLKHQESGETAAAHSAADVIIRWPEKPRALAGALLEKYGAPDEMVSSQLSWNGRRPWRKIVMFRDPENADRPGHLLESVAYGKVPLDRWELLAAMGRGASYDPAARELSARTDAEETNFLALNLADEVIRGRRSPTDARVFYDTTLNLSFSGKSSPYMRRLLFEPSSRLQPQKLAPE